MISRLHYPFAPTQIWMTSALTALALHGLLILALVGANSWLLNRSIPETSAGVPILLELAAVPASNNATMASMARPPEVTTTNETPSQTETESEPPAKRLIKPSTVTPLVPVLDPPPVLQQQTPPQNQPTIKTSQPTRPSQPEQQSRSDAAVASSPSVALNRKALLQQASQVSASSASDSTTIANWHSRILAHLETYKRYPRRSLQRRQQGVVEIQFTIDRQGYLLQKQLLNSSGSMLLDRSALAMVEQAQPLPAPPEELPDMRIKLTVPVRFFLN